MKQYITLLLIWGIMTSFIHTADIQSLSPTESATILRQLTAQSLYPLPSSLIMNLGLSLELAQQELSSSLFTEQGYPNIKSPPISSISLILKLSPNTSLGIRGGTSSAQSAQLISTTFKATHLNYAFTHLVGYHTLYTEENMSIHLLAEVGLLNASYILQSFSESLSTSSRIERKGTTLSGAIGIEARYYLSPIWSIGIKPSYFFANITSLKNLVNSIPNTSHHLNLSGPSLSIFTGFYL